MADLVMGAMASVIPKLYELLEKEYTWQTGVKEHVRSLTHELELAQAMLRKVGEVPWEQLDEHVQLWAREVREASYNMEDILDTFLVRVQGPDPSKHDSLSLSDKLTKLWTKIKARHKISSDIKDIMSRLQEVTERCRKYKVEDIVARVATVSTVDPRLHAMYNKVKDLVGIDKSSGELMSMLQSPKRNEVPNPKMKIVSIVGGGGLGKTTLARAVYDKLKGDYDCGAFVPVGRNLDLKKVFKDILIDLDKKTYLEFTKSILDERQLIDELHSFLKNKRYFIVIDDIWEIQSWEAIKLAIDNDENCEGRIIVSTRKLEVATKADDVYKLQPLPYDSSRELLYARIYGHEERYVHSQPDEISDKFIRKCGGIPLAIITMASLLAGKQREDWSELYKTIHFGCKDNKKAENTMRILSFSYYDLPSHLRTCLLYLSAFPEDSVIPKDSLVWMWVAEGFIRKEKEKRLFETGEGYFKDLINRSLIQAVESSHDSNNIIGCRIHDIVLDFIRSMSQEENFFNVLDNDDQGTLQRSNARRLANHNRIIGRTHLANHFEMLKLRTFIALQCDMETWAPISSFRLLRVLAIENCKTRDGSLFFQVEDLGHLHHLRFLSLSRTLILKIPEEIGALRFLQTLDLSESYISEWPSSCSFLKRIVCLRISLDGDSLDGKVLSVEGMTTLEELSINVSQFNKTRIRLVKDLECLGELRVLDVNSTFYYEENKRDLVESLCHLRKLQRLTVNRGYFVHGEPAWKATELVLSRHLQHLSVYGMEFYKLPSCINPSCLPNLAHLDLSLQVADELDLKILGGLPELYFLGLNLLSSLATIRNISDSDACYFPKLRCCKLTRSMVLFVANKVENSVSFHIWNGQDDIAMPSVSGNEQQTPTVSSSDDELNSDDGSHIPLQRHSKLQHGIAALARYVLAFLQLVLAFLKKRSLQKVSHHPLISNGGSSLALNGEDPIDLPSVSDGKNKRTICSTAFMPNLQVLRVTVRGRAITDHRYLDNLGWEYLSSLQEINVDGLYSWDYYGYKDSKVEAALRRTAQVHPNRPTLRMKR